MIVQVLIVCLITFIGVRPETCKMPDDRVGECKPLYGCNEILTALTNNYISPDFVEQLHCGGTITRPYICCTEIAPPITHPTRDPVPNRYSVSRTETVCGFQHDDGYFRSTNETVITEYPWLARIGYRRNGEDDVEYHCSGSLINPKYVLTAAQCLLGDLKPSSVRLGEYHILNQTDCTLYSDIAANDCNDAEDYGVEGYVVHPGYNTSEVGGIHDIALIKLNRTVVYTDYIRPVCLPHSDMPRPKEGDELTISGWGWLTDTDNVYLRSQLKQKATVVIQPKTQCESKRGIKKTVRDGQGCSLYGRSKVCLYENGGPIVFSHKYRWYQEGIAVDGKKNCILHKPLLTALMYTKVSDYIDWIKESVGVL